MVSSPSRSTEGGRTGTRSRWSTDHACRGPTPTFATWTAPRWKSGPLSARSNFYRAVTLASLATRGKAVNQNQLAQARKFYAAAAAEAASFAKDLRFISPRVLELLK